MWLRSDFLSSSVRNSTQTNIRHRIQVVRSDIVVESQGFSRTSPPSHAHRRNDRPATQINGRNMRTIFRIGNSISLLAFRRASGSNNASSGRMAPIGMAEGPKRLIRTAATPRESSAERSYPRETPRSRFVENPTPASMMRKPSRAKSAYMRRSSIGSGGSDRATRSESARPRRYRLPILACVNSESSRMTAGR